MSGGAGIAGTGGADGAPDGGSAGVEAGRDAEAGVSQGSLCPPGPFELPRLTGVTVETVAGFPPADGFAPGFAILEGPVWIGNALYLSQISNDTVPPTSRILKVVPGGSVSIFLADSGSNGLAVDQNGDVVAGVHKDGTISRFPMANPTSKTVLAATYGGARFDSPNDLAIRSDGTIYFSDPDWQAPSTRPQAKTRVYRIDPGGTVSLVDEDLVQPNGVTLAPDEKTLYVSGSSGVYRYDVMADGTITGKAEFKAGLSGTDGMGLDCAGNLYVTQGTSLIVFTPSGTEVGRIALTNVQAVTNVAFGGPERKTLYVTSLGQMPTLRKLELNVPGYPY